MSEIHADEVVQSIQEDHCLSDPSTVAQNFPKGIFFGVNRISPYGYFHERHLPGHDAYDKRHYYTSSGSMAEYEDIPVRLVD